MAILRLIKIKGMDHSVLQIETEREIREYRLTPLDMFEIGNELLAWHAQDKRYQHKDQFDERRVQDL